MVQKIEKQQEENQISITQKHIDDPQLVCVCVSVWSREANKKQKPKMELTWPAAILRRALLTLESVASETPIWVLISSPTVIGLLGFTWPDPELEPDPGLFLEPEPEGDLRPNAFLTLLAAVEVRDRCKPGEPGEWWAGESELGT